VSKVPAIANLKTVEWVRGHVRMIDQTRIPERLVYVNMQNYRQVAKAIETMVVRGAPAIGAAAAMGMALAANTCKSKPRERSLRDLEVAAKVLGSSRPTAWNLFWAIDRMMRKAYECQGSGRQIALAMVEEAQRIAEEDIAVNHRIGEFGASLLTDGDQVLTHCNAGTLATVSYGTALAPIRTAIAQGKKVSVIADETRPRLQGAKLTSYELLHDGIPVTLIVDGAAGYVMKIGMVQKVIVGADRITRKYVANKVGTYMIALAARTNNIPFYVAAPTSTFDLGNGSGDVKIEERDQGEVTQIAGKRIPPRGVHVFNPAFDLTPLDLVQGLITERGVIAPTSWEDVKSSLRQERVSS